MLGKSHIHKHTQKALSKPVNAHGAGNGEADPQRHQRHNIHHGLAGLGRIGILGSFLILHTFFVGDQGVVHLLGNQHGQHLAACRQDRQQEQANICPQVAAPGTEVKVGNSSQVHTEEGELQAVQGGGVRYDALDLICKLGQDGCSDHLLKVGIPLADQVRHSLLDHIHDLAGSVQCFVEHINDRLPDDRIQREQQQQRH